MVAEQRTTCSALVQPQQPVVDEDAGELVADRLVDQHGRHRAVDSARQPADDPALADLRADLAISAALKCAMRPVARQAARCGAKLPISCPARRVRHLGMELHGVELALLVRDGRERRALRHAHHLEPGRQPRDAVAVAHPHGVALALLPEAVRTAAVVAASSRSSARPNSRWCPPLHAAAQLLAPWPARRSRCRAPAGRP